MLPFSWIVFINYKRLKTLLKYKSPRSECRKAKEVEISDCASR